MCLCVLCWEEKKVTHGHTKLRESEVLESGTMMTISSNSPSSLSDGVSLTCLRQHMDLISSIVRIHTSLVPRTSESANTTVCSLQHISHVVFRATYSATFRAWFLKTPVNSVNSGRQVERIQHFTHLLADPNREPERGEVYLSPCFRHAPWTAKLRGTPMGPVHHLSCKIPLEYTMN